MRRRAYLDPKTLQAPVNYEWTRRFSNKLQAVPGEDYPKLWDALEELSVRAAFALGVACSEWTAARLQHLADVSDLVLRIEASWAATIDWRYASLPEPEPPPPSPSPDPVAAPVWLASLFLTDLHDYYGKTYGGAENQGVRGTALPAALLVRHITPKKAGFDKWLTESMRKAKAHYAAKKKPIEKEAPVPPDFFDPEFKWSEEAVAASQARLLASLDPKNPYLRMPDQMRADGFNSDLSP